MLFLQPLIFLFFVIFLEMMETALFTIPNGFLLENQKNNKTFTFSRVLQMKKDIKEVVIIILILDNVFNYLLSFYISRIISGLNISYFMQNALTVFFSFFVILLIILVKILGITKSVQTMKYSGNLLYYMFVIFRPMSLFINNMFKFFLKDTESKSLTNSRSEIMASLDSFEEAREIRDELNMAKNVFFLRDINLNQIMNTRNDFIMVEFSQDIEIMKHRLLPLKTTKNVIVWEEEEDNILGTINLQHFFIDLSCQKIKKVIYYIQPPEFFIQNTDVYTLFKHFKTNKSNMIFVIDEDGSISGIITLRDIIQEIVGDFEEDDYFFQEQEDSYLVDGKYNIRMLNRKIDINLPESDDFSSLSGLMIDRLKRLPKNGDSILIQKIKLVVKEIKKNSIEKILIYKDISK